MTINNESKLYSCLCLNVSIRVREVSKTNIRRPLTNMRVMETTDSCCISWQIDALVDIIDSGHGDDDHWHFIRCILCAQTIAAVRASHRDRLLYSSSTNIDRTTPIGIIPVQLSIYALTNEQMAERRRQPYYSQAMKVLMLPKIAIDEHCDETKLTDDDDQQSNDMSKTLTMTECDDDGAQQVHAVCVAYLRSEQELMETRIRDYIRTQHDQFERLLAVTNSERDRILRLLLVQRQTTTSGTFRQHHQQQQSPTTKTIGAGGANSTVLPSPTIHLSIRSRPSPPLAAMNGQQSGRTIIGGNERRRDQVMMPVDDELFSLDEDQQSTTITTLNNNTAVANTFLSAIDDEAEEEEEDEEGVADDTDDSGNGDDIYCAGNETTVKRQGTTVVAAAMKSIRPPMPGAGMLASKFGTSLPVTIPGRFWPPKDAKDSIPDGGQLSSADENDDDDDGGRRRRVHHQRTLLPTHKDLYSDMRETARSIQAADDPERLFGERPQRRRYRTGETVIQHHPRAMMRQSTVATGGGGGVDSAIVMIPEQLC